MRGDGADLAVGFRHGLAQAPEVSTLLAALSDEAVRHLSASKAPAKRASSSASGSSDGGRPRSIRTTHSGMGSKGWRRPMPTSSRNPRPVPERSSNAVHPLSHPVPRTGEQRQRGRWIAHGEKRRADPCGAREEPEARCSDDAECAFRPDEEVADVVACIVLRRRRSPCRMRPSGRTASIRGRAPARFRSAAR